MQETVAGEEGKGDISLGGVALVWWRVGSLIEGETYSAMKSWV